MSSSPVASNSARSSACSSNLRRTARYITSSLIGVPVGTHRGLVLLGEAFRDDRLRGGADRGLQLRIGEFLRLIVVLDGRPARIVEVDPKRREVRELAVRRR